MRLVETFMLLVHAIELTIYLFDIDRIFDSFPLKSRLDEIIKDVCNVFIYFYLFVARRQPKASIKFNTIHYEIQMFRSLSLIIYMEPQENKYSNQVSVEKTFNAFV